MVEPRPTFQNTSATRVGKGSSHTIEWFFEGVDGEKVFPSRYRLTLWSEQLMALDFIGDDGRKVFYYKWFINNTAVAYALSSLIRDITPMEEDASNLNTLIKIWEIFNKHKLPFVRPNSIKVTRAGNNTPVVRRFWLGSYQSMLPILSCHRVFPHLYS